MTTLTVTSKGQVTLRKEVLRHLGIKPGDKIDVDLMPGGSMSVRAAAPERTGSLEDAFNFFGPWEGPPVSLEDLKEAAAAGWASAMDYEKDQLPVADTPQKTKRKA